MSGSAIKHKRKGILLCIFASFGALGVPWSACHSPSQTTLTISVASSVQDAIVEAENAYERENPGVFFRNNFGSSGTLARQIEQGAPVDAFLSAGVTPMDLLDGQGLLGSGSRSDLLRNSLVLIAPAQSTLQSFEQLTSAPVRLIAMGDPGSVPAGQYSKQTLDSLSLYDKLKSKIVLGTDVRQVLTYVETGNADAGFVYASDAQTSGKVRIVAVAPEASHNPIVYPIAEIKGSKNDAVIRGFIAFLRSPTTQAIFARYGFRMA